MWYQSHLKARDGDTKASIREETTRFPSLGIMEYRAESEGRWEPVAQGIPFSPRQFESMMAGIRRQFDHDLKTHDLQGVVPNGAQAYPKSICPKKRSNNRSRSLIFSGTSKDPKEYLQWESNMEKWLQSSNLSKEEKLAHAVSAFTRTAREWWLRECTQYTYKKPVLEWRDLKNRMYQEFVEKYQSIPMSVAPTTPTTASASLLIPELKPKAPIPLKEQVTELSSPLPSQREVLKVTTKVPLMDSHHILDKKPQEEMVKKQSLLTPIKDISVDSFKCSEGKPELENQEVKADTCALWMLETIKGSKLNVMASSKTSRGVQKPASPSKEECFLPQQPDVLAQDQPLVLASFGDRFQILVFEPGGITLDSKTVSNNLITKVTSSHSPSIFKQLDLRSNPLKGGGDGVIQERLYVSNTKQNSEDEQPEEERENTAGLGALDKANDAKMELSKARTHAWARRKKPRSVKPKHPGKHLKPKRKRLWVYGKAHRSIGSEEESKALEARPPDGKSITHGPKPNQKPS